MLSYFDNVYKSNNSCIPMLKHFPFKLKDGHGKIYWCKFTKYIELGLGHHYKSAFYSNLEEFSTSKILSVC